MQNQIISMGIGMIRTNKHKWFFPAWCTMLSMRILPIQTKHSCRTLQSLHSPPESSNSTFYGHINNRKHLEIYCLPSFYLLFGVCTLQNKETKSDKLEIEKGFQIKMQLFDIWKEKIHSKPHWFSLQTSSSSSGVKSFLILNVLRISSRVLPLIISATVWQVKSSRFFVFRYSKRERERCMILGRGWYGCKGVDDASEAYRYRNGGE